MVSQLPELPFNKFIIGFQLWMSVYCSFPRGEVVLTRLLNLSLISDSDEEWNGLIGSRIIHKGPLVYKIVSSYLADLIKVVKLACEGSFTFSNRNSFTEAFVL